MAALDQVQTSLPRWVVLRALVVACRLHNGLACAFLAGAGLLHGGQVVSPESVVAISVAILLLAASSHLVNDIIDLQADRTNRPGRPLPRGLLSLSLVGTVASVFLAAGLLVGLLFWSRWWFWWIFWSVTGPGYSLLAKGRRWLAPVWTATVIASCYLPGAGSDGLGARDLAVGLVIWYFLFFREFVKSLEDTPGDSLAGYQTLAGGSLDSPVGLVLLALPLLAVGAVVVFGGLAGRWGHLAGAAFLVFLVAALLALPISRRRQGHLSGSFLKLGAFSGLGVLLATTL